MVPGEKPRGVIRVSKKSYKMGEKNSKIFIAYLSYQNWKIYINI